ncbi:MAG: BatA domain-containing protein [Phycisphaerales bacterium]
MTLLHPAIAVAGALAVAIPILIHLLLRRRRKPVMWGAMKFLLEAYRQQRRRLRLEQFLLLAARCLVIFLAAMAIARPLFEGASALGAGSARTVYILLDNSVASALRDGDQTALDAHKRTADALLASLGPADRAALVTLAGPADPVVLPASNDIAAVRSLVERIGPADSAADIAGALQRVRADLVAREDDAAGRSAQVVLLTDFLAGSADAARPLPQALAGIEGVTMLAFPPRAAAPANVQITAIEPLRPVLIAGEPASLGGGQVRVRLRRTGPGVSEASLTTLRLRFEGQGAAGVAPAAQARVSWSPGQSDATATLQIDPERAGAPASSAMLIAEIDRDALDADNARRRPLPTRDAISVGVVARAVFGATTSVDRLTPAEWLRMALRPTTVAPIDIRDIEPTAIDPASLAGLDALLVPRPDLVDADAWRRLRRFADAGGLVVVFPPAETRVHLWADEMVGAFGIDWRIAREASEPASQSLSEETPDTPIFALLAGELADLLRPVRIERALPIESAVAPSDALLRLTSGAPWVAVATPGQGEAEDAETPESGEGRGRLVYVASAPTLTWTNLPAMPLMVPLVQEIVRQGVGGGGEARAVIAGDAPEAPRRTVTLAPTHEGAERVSVDRAGRASAALRSAGVYRALDEAGATQGVIAVNPDADGARTDTQARSTIESWLAGAGLGQGDFRWIESDRLATEQAGALANSERRGSLSVWLFGAALVIAGLEALMARFFSHAKRAAPTRREAHAPEAGA